MAIGSNSIQFRHVQRRVVQPDGGIFWKQETQYRTRDVVSSVLGLIPLASAWSAWQWVEQEALIWVDEAGNQISP